MTLTIDACCYTSIIPNTELVSNAAQPSFSNVVIFSTTRSAVHQQLLQQQPFQELQLHQNL
jgi:hypothetical protein